ncbi:hypothetical protein HUG17_6384 [Dermatophagoides farinae]|uniref:Transposase Tc1-like domain-containing protein n=1 Tax=Dermatophagoides farinae TaxID=6954 RepID=A0A9D4P5G4_DERFA|nr:hypothetical protein HUG17_6384 [Dermatophagoides farinae]
MDKQLEKTVLKRMVIQYHKDGLSIRKITEKMKTSKELANHLDVSKNTVRKYIKMTEYGARISRKKPLLSKKNKNKRRLWANKMVEMPLDYWKKYIHTIIEAGHFVTTKR